MHLRHLSALALLAAAAPLAVWAAVSPYPGHPTTSPDIVFGCALSYAQTVTIPPTLNFFYERNILSLYWNGSGFTLQQADELNGSWTNTIVTNSPYILEIPPDIKFFQLRK